MKTQAWTASTFATVAMILLGLSACSTSSKKETGPVADSASHRLARRIAAADDLALLDRAYEAMINDQFPGKIMAGEARRLTDIFYRTEGLVRDYDAKLTGWAKSPDEAAATASVTDESYARILAAWVLREETLSRLNYFYARNLATAIDAGNGSTEAKRRQDAALVSNGALRKAIFRSTKKTDQLATHSLIEGLRPVHEEFEALAKEKNVDASDILGSVQDNKLKSPAHFRFFYLRNRNALSVEVANALKNEALNSEIDTLARDFQTHLKHTFETREPQSAGAVVPDAGPKGNVSGTSFTGGRWALTYDDGPGKQTTEQVLQSLKDFRVKATFFTLAANASRLPSTIANLKQAGMDLANHSYGHSKLTEQNQKTLDREIIDSSAALTSIYGFKPKLFRCPYGACGGHGSHVREMIAREKMIHVGWNVDSLDWQDKNPITVFARVKKQMAVQKKGIILFHDIHTQTVEATRRLLMELAPSVKSGKTRLLTVQQAIDELNSPEGMP